MARFSSVIEQGREKPPNTALTGLPLGGVRDVQLTVGTRRVFLNVFLALSFLRFDSDSTLAPTSTPEGA